MYLTLNRLLFVKLVGCLMILIDESFFINVLRFSDTTVTNYEYSETKTAITNNSVEFSEKNAVSSSVDEIPSNESDSAKKPDSAPEKSVKSTVISLRNMGKNYDNLPALGMHHYTAQLSHWIAPRL